MKAISTTIIVCAVILGALSLYGFKATDKDAKVVWEEDFNGSLTGGKDSIIKGWKLQGKPGTSPAVFSIKQDKKNGTSYTG